MALGATAAQVRTLVMRQAAIVVGIGVAAGLGGALLLGRWLGALAFGVAPSDPAILAATVLLLAAVAAVAAWLPARRAARIEPRIAMQDAQLSGVRPGGLDAAPHDARERPARVSTPVARVRRHRGAHRRVERAGVRRRHAIAREAVLRVERRDVVVDRLRERLRRRRSAGLRWSGTARAVSSSTRSNGSKSWLVEKRLYSAASASDHGDGPSRRSARTSRRVGSQAVSRRTRDRPVEPVEALRGQRGRERAGQRNVLDPADDPLRLDASPPGSVRARAIMRSE